MINIPRFTLMVHRQRSAAFYVLGMVIKKILGMLGHKSIVMDIIFPMVPKF